MENLAPLVGGGLLHAGDFGWFLSADTEFDCDFVDWFTPVVPSVLRLLTVGRDSVRWEAPREPQDEGLGDQSAASGALPGGCESTKAHNRAIERCF